MKSLPWVKEALIDTLKSLNSKPVHCWKVNIEQEAGARMNARRFLNKDLEFIV